MNEHLTPVFEIVIPAIEESGIAYGVYGGVATAGINGAFVRLNPDVDVFVLRDDYETTIELVTALEGELGWTHYDAEPLKEKRPKREWSIVGKRHDIFSVIPVYPIGDKVQFIFGVDLVPKNPLTQERRGIDEHSFVTPSVEFIRELFVHKLRSGKLSEERLKKCRDDAKVLFPEHTLEELLAEFAK